MRATDEKIKKGMFEMSKKVIKKQNKNNMTIYFQPPGIKKEYCEAGMIHESDPDYIWYLDEPCKILINEVKIIPSEQVAYDKKNNVFKIKSE